jgi:hypothetical protein
MCSEHPYILRQMRPQSQSTLSSRKVPRLKYTGLSDAVSIPFLDAYSQDTGIRFTLYNTRARDFIDDGSIVRAWMAHQAIYPKQLHADAQFPGCERMGPQLLSG